MWQWSVLTSVSDIAPLRSEWDALVERSPFPHIFQLHGWHLAWHQANPSEWNLKTIVARDAENKLRLIAPLTSPKHHPRHWRYGVPQGTDYEGLIYDREDRQAVSAFKLWLRQCSDWDSIALDSLLPTLEESSGIVGSPLTKTAHRLVNIFRRLVAPFPQSYRIELEGHWFVDSGAFPSLVEKTLGRDHRKHENWFTKQRPLSAATLRDPQAIHDQLPEALDLHAKKWSSKGAGQDSLNRNFLMGLVATLGEREVLRLDLLRWGKQLVAAHFGFQWRGRLYWYLTTYDPEVASHSPGKLLLANALRQLSNEGITEFDFLRGNESYKALYLAQPRRTVSLRAFRSRWSLLRTHLTPG